MDQTGVRQPTSLKIRPRNRKSAAPAMQSTRSKATMTGMDVRTGVGGRGANCAAASADAGRGLPTWEADRMNLVSAEAGACGTTIFWKQVGHSTCPPLVLESAVICWPQTGHANLN